MTPLLLKSRDIAVSTVRLADGVELSLDNRVWASNLADTNPVFANHMFEAIYCRRTARLDAIDLLELPARCLVVGGGHFITSVNGGFLEDQWPPYVDTMQPSLRDALAAPLPVHEIAGEKLLIGRFGVSTWGHWLGELLPKILLAERAFPGRFSYVLPDRIRWSDDREQSIWARIPECLIACGLDPTRVCALDTAAHYRFDHLFAVTSVWSDFVMHPAASDALRRSVADILPNGTRKLAVFRDPSCLRQAVNACEIYDLLAERGYGCIATGSLPFEQQVALFKSAESVFGVLGSDLTNLVFAPEGVSLVSIAPDVFGDRFFYALVLDRQGRMADMRGPVVAREAVEGKSSFRVDMTSLAKILD